ncbi:hypothetical protein SAMN05216464_102554 [Mucilaginibacter pineti]|uniref:Uncharacterized protein n=1 Tax=Mucilaginibacter pineti TaxID=1391627 RepID=A0A1G6XJ14_9SPHI|nr:hypothetical protein [Mucilaginibacter pineti]SDD78160.1 hypothetical protein SAMN05216464_102554 [Mucilaginibacter pineti]
MKPVKLGMAIIAMYAVTVFASCTKDDVKPAAQKTQKIMDGGPELPPQLPPPPPPPTKP